MARPEVSVIMPAYNHELYVGEAIESVLNQTFTDFEFIIINDGSTDRTENVIKKYLDCRIRYYSQTNKGAHATLNRGLSLATGQYIAIINSDDVYCVQRLSRLVNTVKSQKAQFIITDVELIDESSHAVSSPWLDGLRSVYNDTGSLEMVFISGNIAVTTSNFFFRSKIVETLGEFKAYRYVHDYDYALRALLYDRDKFLLLRDEKLLFYRRHRANTISESHVSIILEEMELLRELAPLFVRSDNDKKFTQYLMKHLGMIHNSLAEEIRTKEKTLQCMLGSFSWKVTSPIRKIGKMLSRE